MPINRKLMRQLIKTYGAKKAQDVYYGMLEEAKHGKRPKGMFPGEIGAKPAGRSATT